MDLGPRLDEAPLRCRQLASKTLHRFDGGTASEVRRFLIRSTADAGWKVGTWVGLFAGTIAGRSLRWMVIGSVGGMAIGWIAGRINTRAGPALAFCHAARSGPRT